MKTNTSRLFPLTRLDAALASILGLISLAFYVRTLAPDLLYGDSGEFQTVVYSLGMTHPTGYPVYVLFGRLFTLLPIGNLAWRVNLFSAALGALTVACVYLIARLISGWRWAAATAALTLAVTPLFWYFSVIAELYVPACACLGGVLLFLLLWRQTGKWPWLAASSLLGGLSLGVHSSVALAAPGILVYLAITSRSRQEWLSALGGALLGVLLALGAFLVLDVIHADAGYYNATVVPSLSVWDMNSTDFDSPFERLSFLYAAKQFNYAMFSAPTRTMPFIAKIYMDVLGKNFAPLWLALAGCGFLGVFVPRWQEGLLLLLGWGVQMFFITNYDIFDVVVFFVPTYVFLAVWAGVGLGSLMEALAWGVKRIKLEKAVIPATALLGIACLGLTVRFWGGMVMDAWSARAPIFMRGTEFESYPYPLNHPQATRNEAQAIVNAVEENAIVFLGWDLLFPCYFIAHIELNRHGMDFHETYPQEGVTEVGRSTADYIEASLPARPVYFLEHPSGTQMRRFEVRLVRRNGLTLYQVVSLRPQEVELLVRLSPAFIRGQQSTERILP